VAHEGADGANALILEYQSGRIIDDLRGGRSSSRQKLYE
jgi:hypothetical protein